MRLYVAANYPINEVTLFLIIVCSGGNRTTKAHADGFDALPLPNSSRPCWKRRNYHSPFKYASRALRFWCELIVHPITPQAVIGVARFIRGFRRGST